MKNKDLKLDDDRVIYKVSEWAEEKRFLPPETSPLSGRYTNAYNPMMVEIMDCMSKNNTIQEVALMKGSQLGWTTSVLENFIGYTIDYCPGPMMFMKTDKYQAEKAMEFNVDHMIRTAGISYKIFKHNKIKKEFIGGFLSVVGADNPAKFRIYAIKFLMLDEIDSFPTSIGKEGDPVALAVKRTNTYGNQRKIMYGSTPLIKGKSRIEKLYLKGDQRRYFVPCKGCGEFQTLEFKNLKWEIDEDGHLIVDSVGYSCKNCGILWSNTDKEYFLSHGEWRPTSKSVDPTFRSYHLSSLYCGVGMYRWEKLVRDWLDAQNDIFKVKTFINTVLGETWEELGKK